MKRCRVVIGLFVFLMVIGAMVEVGYAHNGGRHSGERLSYTCYDMPSHLHSNGSCPYDAAGYESQARFDIEGNEVYLKHFLEEGTTMVELRRLCDALGVETAWDAASNQVICARGNEQVILKIGDKSAVRNGHHRSLSVPPLLVNGQTWLPIRDIAESFGMIVDYDHHSKRACIR